MTVYTKILSDNGKWKLSANYDEIKKHYYGVSLKVPKKAANGLSRLWDNNTYLYEELFPMVEMMNNDVPNVPVSEFNTDPYNYLKGRVKDIEQLYELLLFGKSLGWDRVK